MTFFCQVSRDIGEQSIPPVVLTTIPPVGIATRPTAIVASTVSKQSLSNFSIKNTDEQQNQLNSSFSAFHRINSNETNLPKASVTKSTPLLMDIPQHKALERGQQLTKVHISHPQSPSIIHVDSIFLLNFKQIPIDFFVC